MKPVGLVSNKNEELTQSSKSRTAVGYNNYQVNACPQGVMPARISCLGKRRAAAAVVSHYINCQFPSDQFLVLCYIAFTNCRVSNIK